MAVAREQALQQWVVQQLNDTNLTIHPLAGDASFRRYARIHSNNKRYMLMDAPPDKENSLPFVQIDQWLDEHGVRVPHIVAKDLEQGFILLEDFGDVLLSTVLNEQTVDQYYAQAIKQLIGLQQLPTDSEVIPAYSHEKLVSEMALFHEWFLKFLNIEPTEQEQALIQQTYQLLADTALAQPQVVVHRDYHSRNLMVLTDEADLGVIDFQDAVIGAYTYDLVSILRDAYVQWPVEQVQKWVGQFWELLPSEQTANKTLPQFMQEFDYMAAQRHLKILGIFIRLNLRDGKTGYMKDIPLVFFYLLQELQPYAELAEFNSFLKTRVLPAFLQQYPDQPQLAGFAA